MKIASSAMNYVVGKGLSVAISPRRDVLGRTRRDYPKHLQPNPTPTLRICKSRHARAGSPELSVGEHDRLARSDNWFFRIKAIEIGDFGPPVRVPEFPLSDDPQRIVLLHGV